MQILENMGKTVNFKILLEYCGTGYSGWQVQKNAKTVQGTRIDAVKNILAQTKGHGKFIELKGSGRTDKGVHARGQVAHLKCETMLAPEILKFKLNDLLPSDINILEIEKAPDKFHARHSAKSRQYIYRISTRRTAFEKKFVWWIKDNLDIEKMKHCAECFRGMHDFSSFSEKTDEDLSTKVMVEDISIKESDYIIEIRIKASHFLWKMVRRIIGILAEAGRGNISEKDIEGFLNRYSDEPANFTAPPSGLFLERVEY